MSEPVSKYRMTQVWYDKLSDQLILLGPFASLIAGFANDDRFEYLGVL